jgi:hypothetical protein
MVHGLLRTCSLEQSLSLPVQTAVAEELADRVEASLLRTSTRLSSMLQWQPRRSPSPGAAPRRPSSPRHMSVSSSSLQHPRRSSSPQPRYRIIAYLPGSPEDECEAHRSATCDTHSLAYATSTTYPAESNHFVSRVREPAEITCSRCKVPCSDRWAHADARARRHIPDMGEATAHEVGPHQSGWVLEPAPMPGHAHQHMLAPMAQQASSPANSLSLSTCARSPWTTSEAVSESEIQFTQVCFQGHSCSGLVSH